MILMSWKQDKRVSSAWENTSAHSWPRTSKWDAILYMLRLDWASYSVQTYVCYLWIQRKLVLEYDLPQQYLSQPRLCADVSALQAHVHFSATPSTSDPSPPDLPDEDTSSPCCDEISSRKVQKVLCMYYLNVTHAISLSLETYCS